MQCVKTDFTIPREVVVSWCVWTLGVFYSIYRFATATNSYFENYEDVYGDFTEGWEFIGRKKDSTDNEWNVILLLYFMLFRWMLPYLIASEVLREKGLITMLKILQILSPLCALLYQDGVKVTIILLCSFTSFEIASRFKKVWIVWVCAVGTILFSTIADFLKPDLFEFVTVHSQAHVIMYWNVLKLTSYYIDVIKGEEEHNLLSALCYCFYLPLLCGPFVRFGDFKKVFLTTTRMNLSQRLEQLIWGIIRFGFWLYFLEFALHFVYVNAIIYQTEMVSKFSYWALCGFGYCLGQYFHMKYVVFYGIPTTIAKFENIPIPGTPKCIGRIHLYSDMWRYFDVGLHQFLTKYIYHPTLKTQLFNNKLFAVFLCFIFVFAWHGVRKYVFIWSALNFLGMILERLSMNVGARLELDAKLGQQWARRVGCMGATLLTVLAAISNFYFLAGQNVGDLFVERLIKCDLVSFGVILFFMYHLGQLSTELRMRSKVKKS